MAKKPRTKYDARFESQHTSRKCSLCKNNAWPVVSVKTTATDPESIVTVESVICWQCIAKMRKLVQ